MLSFIIIGRNEGWKLPKCLQSVFDTIAHNGLKHYEVIYVDSKSTDKSIDNVKAFNKIKIIQLTGDINAAIARNVGAKESKGDVLFFIDGDMEIEPSFLPLVYSEKEGLKYDFVSGNWMDYYYTKEGNFLSKVPYLKMDKDIKETTTGGLFLINKEIWDNVEGMRPIFKKSQDIDLGLRLAKRGVFLIRKKEFAANHHTIAYMDKNRMWRDLFAGNHLYGRSLLYRKNIFNKYMYKRLMRNDYSLIILIVSLIFSFILSSVLCFTLYGLIALLRSKVSFNSFIYIIMKDLSVFVGFFIFFPSTTKNIEYQTK